MDSLDVSITPLTRIEVVNRLAIYFRESVCGDDPTRPLLLWMLRRSQALRIPVAVTLQAGFQGIREGEVQTFNDTLQYLCSPSTGVINRRLRSWSESNTRLSSARGYGYFESICGGTIYAPAADGVVAATAWLSTMTNGRHNVTEQAEPGLVVLDFPGWQELRQEFKEAGML